MWMSELADRSGLPVPTIKYYLREGLLHPGESVGVTRSRYDDTHVRRLRLVRALTEVGGMRLEDVRRVLVAVDDPDLSWHEAIGSAHIRLPSATSAEPDAAQLDHVDALLRRHDWELSDASPHREALAGALTSLASLGHPPDDDLLDTYVEAATLIAEREIAGVRATGDRADAAENAVVSTLLLEPVLLTLRRIAQENASRRVSGP
jgi:DNA-binding transcriptional MerR regulator